jgi:hypothetical protein
MHEDTEENDECIADYQEQVKYLGDTVLLRILMNTEEF